MKCIKKCKQMAIVSPKRSTDCQLAVYNCYFSVDLLLLEQCSVEFRKTKTKEITLGGHWFESRQRTRDMINVTSFLTSNRS